MNPNHAPKTGRNGVDKYSCNGYGLVVNGKKIDHVTNELDTDADKASNESGIDQIVEVEDSK